MQSENSWPFEYVSKKLQPSKQSVVTHWYSSDDEITTYCTVIVICLLRFTFSQHFWMFHILFKYSWEIVSVTNGKLTTKCFCEFVLHWGAILDSSTYSWKRLYIYARKNWYVDLWADTNACHYLKPCFDKLIVSLSTELWSANFCRKVWSTFPPTGQTKMLDSFEVATPHITTPKSAVWVNNLISLWAWKLIKHFHLRLDPFTSNKNKTSHHGKKGQ